MRIEAVPTTSRLAGIGALFSNGLCILVVVLTSAISCLTPREARAFPDLESCYGDRLEVSIPTLTEKGGAVSARAVFALPYPNAWRTTNVQPNTLIQDVPCQEEPVEVSKVWGGFMDPRLGQAHFDMSGIDGIQLQWIRLSRAGTEVIAEIESRRERRFLTEGRPMDGGFLRRINEITDAVSGGWLFPDDYRSPIGTRVRASCTSVGCSVEYRIRRNLYLHYYFALFDDQYPSPLMTQFPTPPFIAIDEHVRATILGWITEEGN